MKWLLIHREGIRVLQSSSRWWWWDYGRSRRLKKGAVSQIEAAALVVFEAEAEMEGAARFY
jgi:hypothetical protein